MQTLRFVLDRKYCVEATYDLLNERFLNNHGGFVNLSASILGEINKNINNTKKAVKIIEKEYDSLDLRYMDKTKLLYQLSWDKINNNFFKETTRITGLQWEFRNYRCVLSPFVVGMSNCCTDTIVRGWVENPFTMRKITAHELIFSHIMCFIKTGVYAGKGLSRRQEWAIGEICAYAITGLEEKMLKFWPWVTEDKRYPLNHNYPELYAMQTELKPKYLYKKNFREFINLAAKRSKSLIK